MGKTTGISWTDSTWTPIRARNRKTGKVGWHCVRISCGCEQCYAEELNIRLGTGERYIATADVDLFLDETMLRWPLKWKKPQRIFVCSMTDLFMESVPDEFIDKIFAVMALCPQHTFQVLTKRPERMLKYITRWPEGLARVNWVFSAALRLLNPAKTSWGVQDDELVRADKACDGHRWPLPNVQLGVSTENQVELDERSALLLKTPAAVRWLSVEPMLQTMDLRLLPPCRMHWDGKPTLKDFQAVAEVIRAAVRKQNPKAAFIDWVVLGLESGPHRRDAGVDALIDAARQCLAANVPCFVKQDCALRPGQQGRIPDDIWALKQFPK
jgi:protein gp37